MATLYWVLEVTRCLGVTLMYQDLEGRKVGGVAACFSTRNLLAFFLKNEFYSKQK